MPFIRVNGWTIPIRAESVAFKIARIDDDERSELNDVIVRRRLIRTTYTMETCHAPSETAEGYEGILGGLGHHFPFESNLFSTRGRAPISTAGAAIVGGGKFGNAASVTAIAWDMLPGIIPLEDRWTVIVYRQEAGVFVHYAIRDDGAVYKNGVRDDTLDTSWLMVEDGAVSLSGAPTLFDDLVILAFRAPEDAIVAWHAWQEDELTPFSDLPKLFVDGDVIRSHRATMIGTTEESELLDLAMQPVSADGVTFWKNNARRVPFSLDVFDANPLVWIQRPSLFFSFDNGDLSGTTPVDLVTATNTFAVGGAPVTGVVGQVNEAFGFNGASWVQGGTTSILDMSTATARTFAGWVKCRTASFAATRESLISKFAGASVAGWFFHAFKALGASVVTVRFGIVNNVETLGRSVESIATFPLNQWHHVAVTYDGSNTVAGIKLYIDGAQVSTTTVLDTNPGVTTNAVSFAFARSSSSAINPRMLTGDLDEWGAWSGTRLSSSRIFEIYRRGTRRQRVNYLAE